jgi:ribosome-associated protein
MPFSKLYSISYDAFKLESPDGTDKERLLKLGDQRITDEGIIVIKAQEYRSQVRNLEEALRRLREIIESVAQLPKKRKLTKPTYSSQQKRLDSKIKRGQTKIMRGRVAD